MDLERKLLFIAVAAGAFFLLIGAIVEAIERRANKRFIKRQEELRNKLTIAFLWDVKDPADDLTPAEEHLRIVAMTETRTV